MLLGTSTTYYITLRASATCLECGSPAAAFAIAISSTPKKAGARLPHSKQSRSKLVCRCSLKFVRQVKPVRRKAHYREIKRPRRCPFEPGRGTPRIRCGFADESMLHSIGMNIVQPSKKGILERDLALPILMPDFSPRARLNAIDKLRRN